MSQIARLFLRGSLMNETAKQLSPEDMLQVDQLMKEAWEDPAIQGQKLEFCMALGRTIGNEYKDFEVGKQDALITFWKASLLVLFHESKQCPSCKSHYVTTKLQLNTCRKCHKNLVFKWTPKPQIAQDPIKRKKFFQSVMFNYLRQIFRENKLPSIRETKTAKGFAHEVAGKIISAAIDKQNVSYNIKHIDNDHIVINCETSLLSLKLIKQINDTKINLEQHGLQISIDWHKIEVISILDIPEVISCQIISKAYAKFTSLDTGSDNSSDNSFREHCEHRVIVKDPKTIDYMDHSETLLMVRDRLSDDAQKLFDLIIDTPQDYIDKFGTSKLYRTHIAQYLGKEPKEVDEMKESIRINCLISGIGAD